MEITADFIKDSRIINEGTTSYIMIHKSNIVYKIYKRTIDYILNGTDYELEEDTLNRLKYLVSKKDDVSMTDLPSGLLTCRGKAVGALIKYYENSIDLKSFLKENIKSVDLEFFKKRVTEIVEELIRNGIIPTDPHLGNFLVCFKEDGSYDIKMIDADDHYVFIYPDNKKDVWYDSEVDSCYRVIDLAFKELTDIRQK